MHLTEELVLRAEELLLRRDLEGAARYCRDALAQLDAQSWSSEHGVRLLSVAMQSSWPLGRQDELLELIESQRDGGLLGLPPQAFVLWQVLQLEATGQAQACQAQTLAYLERRRGVQAGRAADAPHLAALCRLYAVDVLVGALGRPAHEAIDFACAQWLDELVGTSSQGGGAEALEGLRAELAALALTQGAPAAAQQQQQQEEEGEPSGATLAAFLRGGALGNAFCTLMGEPNDAPAGDGDSGSAAAGQQRGGGGGGGGAGEGSPLGDGAAAVRLQAAPSSPAEEPSEGPHGAGVAKEASPGPRRDASLLLASQGLARLAAAAKVTAAAAVATAAGAANGAGPRDAQQWQQQRGPGRPGGGAAPTNAASGAAAAREEAQTQPAEEARHVGRRRRASSHGQERQAGASSAAGAWPAVVRQRLDLLSRLLRSPPKEALELLWAVGVALVLYALYTERRVLWARLAARGPLRAVGAAVAQLLGMATAFTPNPVARG